MSFFQGYRLCIKKLCIRIILSKTNSVHIDSDTFKYSYRKGPSCNNIRCHPYKRALGPLVCGCTLYFTFKSKRMTVSCFVFIVQYVCRLTGKAKPEVKLFGVLGRRVGATSGLAFNYPLKGRFSYILRFASVVYVLISFIFHS